MLDCFVHYSYSNMLICNPFLAFFLLLDEGTRMAQSRYLFALSCFKMDLLNEAEAALSPANEPASEVLDRLHLLSNFVCPPVK